MAFMTLQQALTIFFALYLLSFIGIWILIAKRKNTHVLAKASFILAYLFIVPALNFVTNPLAIILGVVALKDIKKNPQNGRSLAITGVSIGVLGLIFAVIGGIIFYLRTLAL